jgi:hypothetical protein
MKELLQQLALNSTLLPEDMAAAIVAGDTPPNEEIVLAVIIGCMDAHAVVVGDPQSSKQERCIAHSVLAASFLSAMAILGEA